MTNTIIVSAFDTDWAWDGENSISVDIPAKTPAEAMSIKKNLRRIAGSNDEVLVKAFRQWREDNSSSLKSSEASRSLTRQPKSDALTSSRAGQFLRAKERKLSSSQKPLGLK